ncbi:MAG: hypothetical protein ABI885_00010 [Gammaproteobacteria bacterium]
MRERQANACCQLITQRDHIGVHFNGRQRGGGKTAVTIFRERSTAQSEQQDARRCMVEEQERHHLARVGEREFLRSGHLHHALHGIEVEMQKPPTPVIDNERFVVCSLEQAHPE